MKVSQSMLKDWEDYMNQEICGSVFEAKYVTNTWDRSWNDSPAKALGRYFEYILTGENPTGYDSAPRPEWMKTASDKDIESFEALAKENKFDEVNTAKMMAPYRLAHVNAKRIRKLLTDSGVTIERSQVRLTNGILIGNIDIEATYKPKGAKKARKINIDVKYSGLIFDKWNRYGWMWTEEQTIYNGKQAIQYESLNGRPVFFLVVSNTNDKDVKFFESKVDDFNKEQHLLNAESVVEKVKLMEEIGWTNYPELEKCSECPIKANCKDRVDVLQPSKIYIDIYS